MNDSLKIHTGSRNVRFREQESVRIPSPACGLTTAEAERSRKRYGGNVPSSRKRTGVIRQFFRNLNDPIIRILIAALLVNVLFTFSRSGWAESAGIAVTVLLSALVSTVSEYSSGSSFEKLYAALNNGSCRVIRDGEDGEIPVSELVRYDLVILRPGDTVPADGILLRGEIRCDESPLTGESRPVRKACSAADSEQFRRDPDGYSLKTGDSAAVFRGSHVTEGSALMLVTAVGDSTLYGAIASELTGEESVSPLKNRLSALARTISRIGYCSAAIVAVVHLADAFWFDAGENPALALERIRDLRFLARELIQALTLAISVVVVAVPEGLPMMITVVLASNMKRMLKSGVLVRRLVGIETAGSVDILFTDKTGTLTTGALAVVSAITAEGEYASVTACPSAAVVRMKAGAAACSSVFNATEKALNRFIGWREPPEPSADRIPFDSARKFAAGVTGGVLYVRGAADYLLPSCRTYLTSDGRTLPMTEEIRSLIAEKMRLYASRSCRILLQAEGEASLLPILRDQAPILQTQTPDGSLPLCFDALFVIRDEIRPEAASAVRDCQNAGIQVVMMTGDNAETAAGIARECGILPELYRYFDPSAEAGSSDGSALVIGGQTLRELTDADLAALLPHLRVISRVTPADKSRLIRLAKESGHVAAMTGDGINDAPALKAADVGFAMGSGTDVAREAGDIVITDDNFVSITQAILFGRTIFESIRKFITFQLTMNLAAVGITVIGTMFGIENPVTVIQMLWVNMVMDTLGSLAFAGEPALKHAMRRKPVRRDEPILNRQMIGQIALTGGYAVLLSVYFLLSPSIRHLFGGGETAHLTRFFALFIFMGIGIAHCTRTSRINLFAGLSRNRAFLVIMPAVALVQLLIVYFGGEVFRCVPLAPQELGLCALFAFTVVPADTIRKCVASLWREREQERKNPHGSVG